MNDKERLVQLLSQVKQNAKEYRDLTGRALGVTGEVAELEAARLLGLELAVVRQEGFDATEAVGGVVRRLQIKGRCRQDESENPTIGAIDRAKPWDAVVLVLLDDYLEAVAIYEAERPAIIAALDAPGSKARNERGALKAKKFLSIGKQRWPPVVTTSTPHR